MTIELTASVIVPTIITDAMLVSCSTPENDYAEWVSTGNYAVGNRVMRSVAGVHKNFENLIAGVNATLPELATKGATPRWLELGATVRWAQFDKKIGTLTTSTGNLVTVLKPGGVEGLALLDLKGISASVVGRNGTGGPIIYNRPSINLDNSNIASVYDWMFGERVQKLNVVLTDLPGQYPNIELTITINSTTGSAVGVLAVGRLIKIGATEYGAGAGIINFGKVSNDGFGNRTWIEGEFANRVTLPIVANRSDFNRIHRQLSRLRSTPSIYIGSELDSLEPLVCYGVFRDLYITVPNFPTIGLNLEIDGLNNV